MTTDRTCRYITRTTQNITDSTTDTTTDTTTDITTDINSDISISPGSSGVVGHRVFAIECARNFSSGSDGCSEGVEDVSTVSIANTVVVDTNIVVVILTIMLLLLLIMMIVVYGGGYTITCVNTISLLHLTLLVQYYH